MNTEESIIPNEQKQDDEISLIDLFAVLVRYRKLIVIGTFVVTFLVGLYLFVVPVLFPSLSKQKMQVIYNVQVNEFPSDLGQKFLSTTKTNVQSLAVNSMTNLSNFAAIYKQYPAFSSSKLPDGYKYNSYVRELIQKGTFDVKASGIGSSIQITLDVAEKNLETATALVHAVVSQANTDLENYIIPKLKADMNALRTSVENLQQLSTGFDSEILQEQLKELGQLSNFIATYSSFCAVSGEPFFVPEGQGRLIKLVICCFAAFFVLVFTAFVKNAVANVKADPQASKTISDAWKAGK
ncbi:MAG: hypothetical protein J6B81_00550 [Spirochaetaceae bacterium]|nr:hypothetical protein [Spirochaetaceae bacterium]